MNAIARTFKEHAKVGLLPFLLALTAVVALGYAVTYLMAWAVSGLVSDAVWFYALMSVCIVFAWGADRITEGTK